MRGKAFNEQLSKDLSTTSNSPAKPADQLNQSPSNNEQPKESKFNEHSTSNTLLTESDEITSDEDYSLTSSPSDTDSSASSFSSQEYLTGLSNYSLLSVSSQSNSLSTSSLRISLSPEPPSDLSSDNFNLKQFEDNNDVIVLGNDSDSGVDGDSSDDGDSNDSDNQSIEYDKEGDEDDSSSDEGSDIFFSDTQLNQPKPKLNSPSANPSILQTIQPKEVPTNANTNTNTNAVLSSVPISISQTRTDRASSLIYDSPPSLGVAPYKKKEKDSTPFELRGSLKEGFLLKKGDKVKNWKKRYFSLVSPNLFYFRSAKVLLEIK